ncbi:glycine/D-amino acid oxidase-like deaminating enzyme [Microbacterium terrae]|uniref:Gamma-glutamylputrescine oxidoreductase n=1 Tax=Microbacterium terrae TaxID=69369 RepID=A0A0M2GZ03_9MICO|nr:FAD-dependent oxidoreductase [Microbacterium terrae]KJL39332.1 Gamma-glutamylputrescine oxidoreductase [Microbacterium terrae]MBP1078380.1 glycine/D-amino acid oxidase-like deaminating enzyme [Microbacterium terrae]GLJ97860.1 oxidoreductase [Microbacterium terrae]
MGTTVYERQRPAASVIDQSLSGTRQSVFWLDDLPGVEPRPPYAGESTADLVIVGGGYTGLWTALLAKRRDPDARVVVLEAKRVGWAASGRNGGFCEASLTHGRDNGVNRWPDEIDRLDRLGLANLDGMGEDIAAHGIDADWERVGALSVATEPHQLAWLDEWVDEATSRGDRSLVRLDEAATRATVASPAYLGAVWETETNALVHPGKLVSGLATAAEEAGVVIHEASPVHALDDVAGAVKVVTLRGRITAKRVALATNVFPSLLKRNRLMTVPVYDYALMTEPLTDEQLAAVGWNDRQGISDLANQFHYYRLSADNRILYGGYDAVYHYGRRIREDYENRPESFRTLASHFFTTFPQLEGLRFTHRWAGAIDTSTQFCAFFGTARAGRVAYAAGFTGLGVAATRFAGDVMLDLLAGEKTERTELEMVRKRPLPFPPEPAAAIGINATRWSLDRADHSEGRRNLLLRTLDALGLGFDS